MKWVLWAIRIGLVVLAVGGFILFRPHHPAPVESLNDAIKNSTATINFTPFYYRPAVKVIGGPEGYTYKEKSIVVNAELLTFRFINSAQQTIEVTMQLRPADFDMESYPGRIQLNVATGRAIIGANETSTTGAIFGDKTMLFIKAKQIVDDDTLRALLAAFTLN